MERKKPRPYHKPEVVRYGEIQDLTRSGGQGTHMDAQFPNPSNTTKTGF